MLIIEKSIIDCLLLFNGLFVNTLFYSQPLVDFLWLNIFCSVSIIVGTAIFYFDDDIY